MVNMNLDICSPYGGPVGGKIHSDLVALRRKIGGLKAVRTANGPKFAVKSAKDLMIKLRDGLDELEMVQVMTRCDVTTFPLAQGTLAEARITLRIISNDGSYVDFQGAGGGADQQDKAIGKAITYAWKSAGIYSLSLPDAEMADTDDTETPTNEKSMTGVTVDAALASLATTVDLISWKKRYYMPLADHPRAGELVEAAKRRHAAITGVL